jgi:nucleotide-binding universal stress UspA family protein
VTDSDEARRALRLATELSDRLGLRLVLAHVAEDGGRDDADRVLERLVGEAGVAATADRRHAVGDAAARLGEIAAEEAADLIAAGRLGGRLRRRLHSRLADEIGTETPVPVAIAPRAGGRRRRVRPVALWRR